MCCRTLQNQAVHQVKYHRSLTESQQQTDYEANINAFLEEGCDIIIPVGFLLADATVAAAEANPDVPFVIVDVNWVAADNIHGSGFAMNEGTFLTGYLAAGMTGPVSALS